jgi:MFS family permease
MILVAFIFIIFLHDFRDPKYKEVPILKTLRLFARNKHLSKIYVINFILKFFYAWMIIYTPIYLHQYVGFSWSQIGIIFSIMLLPFIILDFPLGKLSDRIGEKKMLIVGFSIISLFTMAIPLFHQPLLWLWAGILFLTRIGAATIEVMSETYFFKSVDEEHADTISFFRNTMSLSFVIAPLVAIPVLLFVPSFEYLFFILGGIMLAGLLISLRLRDVK